MLPSDFPRDVRFHTPGPVLLEDGVAHLRRHRDVQRAMLDAEQLDFANDASYWAPEGQRLHIAYYFMWATGQHTADGSVGRHDVLRGLVESYFRNRAVATMAPTIQAIADSLVREIVQRGTGRFDLATDLAYPLAMRTICALVGLPLEREKWMRAHLDAHVRLPSFEQIRREPAEVEEYLWEAVHQREAEPRDELLDLLIAAWRAGTILDVELLGYLWGSFSAGTDTTGTNIVNAFGLLSEFGLLEEARGRVDDEEWLRVAGEEVLRFGCPFPAGPVLAVRDVRIDDLTIPAGTQVNAWFSAANRDSAVNGGNAAASAPDRFDVERHPNRHLAFGIGAHHCLGAWLARTETVIALQTALRALPELAMDTEATFERYAGLVDGVTRAPFTFDRQGAERRRGTA